MNKKTKLIIKIEAEVDNDVNEEDYKCFNYDIYRMQSRNRSLDIKKISYEQGKKTKKVFNNVGKLEWEIFF